ncbi:MAG TPA: hypothetical protein VGK93_01320 [Candidatus Eisenbacteria bacterium]|jgi:hypothetical protein
MKKLLILLLVLGVGWYGWKQAPRLGERRPSHLAVIENASHSRLEHLRLSVSGRTFVRDRLPPGQRATFAFQVRRDASFVFRWEQGSLGKRTWSGGLVPAGPLLQRHVIRVGDDDRVSYFAERR